MKRFLLSILFILGGLFIVDRLGGMAMHWVNQHTHDVSGPKIKYLINDVHEDILLMGTSRCDVHYVPSIIQDTLGMSVYNGGIDATKNIFAHYLILNHILKCYHPKLICLEVMNNDFEVMDDSFSSITYFAPYFGQNEQADSVFRLADLYYKYQISHLYRYNAKAVSNIAGLLINRNTSDDNGYFPNPEPLHCPDHLEHLNTPDQIDSLKLQYIQRFIDLCHSKQIPLVFTISPMYKEIGDDYYDVIKAIAERNGVPVLDYHTKGLFIEHPEYFRDDLHLWDKSARIYSSIFAADLKRLIDEGLIH